VLVGSLVGDHLLLKHSGPYGIIFINVCVVITGTIVTLLTDFEYYTAVFTVFTILEFPSFLRADY
jgi:uncharacterized YccA/Bax inhibitor family protein